MFTTDSRTEKFLDWMGVKWKYTNDMRFSDMSHDWFTKNIGRSQVKVEKAISDFRQLMDHGSAAPAPILWINHSKKYEVLDGIQRLLAEQGRNSRCFSTYIIETDSLVIVKKIQVFANKRLQGGYQESSEWTMSRAIEVLVNTGAASVDEVAEMGGWTPSAVRDKKQVMDYGSIVKNIGGPEILPDSILRIVANKSERTDFDSAAEPIAEFLNAVKKMKLSAAEAEPYIEEFFTMQRRKGKHYEMFTEKLVSFLGDDEISTRLADPQRRRYQPMAGESKMLKVLKSALTTCQHVYDSREVIPFVDEYFQVLGKIRKVLQQIDTYGKRERKR